MIQPRGAYAEPIKHLVPGVPPKRVDTHSVAGLGMPEPERLAFEQQSLDQKVFSENPVVLTIPVYRVANNRIARPREVPSDLVHPASDRFHLQQRVAGGRVLFVRDWYFDLRKFSKPSLGLQQLVRVIVSFERAIHAALILGPAAYHAIVGLLHFPVFELVRQRARRLRIERIEQHAGSGRIETVHRVDVLPELVSHDCQTVFVLGNADCPVLRRMYVESSRLIHGD